MSDEGAERFSAPDAALGYLYQIRLALLWALRQAGMADNFSVSVETLDDVTFERDGQPSDLLQAKHHRKKQANLTDASPDIWKTFRVWLSAINANQVTDHTKLFLVTTGRAQTGSACELLRLDGKSRDEQAACALLLSVARTSTSQENHEAYALFCALTLEKQIAFLRRVHVIDQTERAHEIITELHRELRLVAHKDRIPSALEAIEGWWFGRVIQQLIATPNRAAISSAEIESKIDDVREQLKRESLPVDDDLLIYTLDEATQSIYEKYHFVRQVKLVTDHNIRIKRAITDYFRAFQQRARWVRKELLFVGDLAAYEQRLFEEWEIRFAQISEDLGEEAAEADQHTVGAALLKWAETVDIPFHSDMPAAPWICRGSLHLMANSHRIGWHPDFKARLAAVLGLAEKEPTT